MDLYLGIDTSCYTTSVCVVDAAGRIVAEARRILSVPQGSRGLSQSNMVYQHMRNLPDLFEQIGPVLQEQGHLCALAVTDRPRRRDDSYMPAFLAGLGFARAMAAVSAIPLYCLSHQENDLMAVLRGQGVIDSEPFYGLHLSGGTTDILYAVPDERGLAITRVGGTSDISAGQFIDRVGVALGLSFPAGLHLDRLARTCAVPVKAGHVFYKNGEVSFSGMETRAQRQIAGGSAVPAELAQWVLATVWDGLRRLLDGAAADRPMATLVAAGGVLANDYLRRQLDSYCRKQQIRLLTAAPEFSCDNASGAAFWADWKNRSTR